MDQAPKIEGVKESKPWNNDDAFKKNIEFEVNKVLNFPSYMLDEQGGIERIVNKSLIPELFRSPKDVSLGIKTTLEYVINNNISPQKQLDLFRAIQLSLNDISVLAENKEATYEHLQFAYQWAGLAREKWELSQDEIKSILNTAQETFKEEKNRDELSYIVSIYLDEDNMLTKQSKIERFMQIITPNLIDKNNHIYHYDSTGNDPVFLKLDTEEKRSFVENLLLKSKKDWGKMFKEHPTIKMYTHYPMPEEFKNFLLSEKEIKQYFPHVAFNQSDTKDGSVLRSEMKSMLNPVFRESLFSDAGIDLNELGPEQAYFVEYMSAKKRGEIKPLKDFYSMHGNNGLKSFLSMSGDSSMGDKILTLGEKLPEDMAKRLFVKYGEYVEAVNSTEDFVKNTYTKENPKPEVIEKIKGTLLIKGRDLLVSQYEKIEKDEFSEEKFNEYIEKAKTDVDLFKNTFKLTMEEDPNTSFSDFIGMTSKTEKSKNVTKEVIKEIDSMVERNYKDPELQNAIKESFHKSLENENTEISTLELNGKTIASNRIDFKEDGSIYFGSFNVDPDYCSAKIGNAFFKAIILPYLKDRIVRADCSARQPISAYYIEAGFVGTKLYDFKGEPSLSIETMPNKIFESKNLSKEEVIKISNENQTGKFIIKKFTQQEDIITDYVIGKSLTRFFFDKKSKNWLALWE